MVKIIIVLIQFVKFYICSGSKVLIILEGDKKYLTYLLRWHGKKLVTLLIKSFLEAIVIVLHINLFF